MDDDSDEEFFNGTRRPSGMPASWQGRPLKSGRGWHWSDPENPGNSVRLYRGDPESEDAVEQGPHVVVTADGLLIDDAGKPVPGSTPPDD
ncbi:hypothetical protein SH611_16030 [Geminicoccaceae bacterium 1502E]|nr:hypothetical protein [Geminicoccaceae bacterium 1502E]